MFIMWFMRSIVMPSTTLMNGFGLGFQNPN